MDIDRTLIINSHSQSTKMYAHVLGESAFWSRKVKVSNNTSSLYFIFCAVVFYLFVCSIYLFLVETCNNKLVTTNLGVSGLSAIRLQSPRVRIHILKFSRKKNSNVMQFVVLWSFLCCISCTPSIQTVRYVLRCLLPFDVSLCDRHYCCR